LDARAARSHRGHWRSGGHVEHPRFSPGVLFVNRVYVDQNRAAHTTQLAVITAGEGISDAFIGVYDPPDGKLLASTGISQPPCRTRGSCGRGSPVSWTRSR
jgi:hypothetical protein